MTAHLRSQKDVKLKIVILGPDGAGKSSVIQGLAGRLSAAGRAVKVRHLKPLLVMRRPGQFVAIVVDPHGKPPRSALVSLAKILVWLMEEWFAHLFQDRKQTLLICDRYYHDLLVDPIRYRYGGPARAARWIGKLMPQPDLWLLLDAPAEVLQSRKQEVAFEETLRQCSAYRAFVLHQRNHAMIDAARSLGQVTEDAEEAIIKALARNENDRK